MTKHISYRNYPVPKPKTLEEANEVIQQQAKEMIRLYEVQQSETARAARNSLYLEIAMELATGPDRRSWIDWEYEHSFHDIVLSLRKDALRWRYYRKYIGLYSEGDRLYNEDADKDIDQTMEDNDHLEE